LVSVEAALRERLKHPSDETKDSIQSTAMVNLTADVTRDFTGVKVYSAFTDPSTQTPLFVAEYIAASYRMSDTYANSPRYLYYVLLVLVFFTQWNEWLANLFVGVSQTILIFNMRLLTILNRS